MHALRSQLAVLVLTLAVALPAQAEIGLTIAATSDYVFRGVSQTQGDPAVQAGLRLQGPCGWYASAWMSGVDFASDPGASKEIDYVAGWNGAVGKAWNADINLTRFAYRGASDLDYSEWIATATYEGRAWLMLGLSNDVFATRARGIYAQLGMRFPVGDRARIEVAGGRYDLHRAYGHSYLHGQVTAVWQLHPRMELRLTAHTTDSNARRLFGDVASPRLEAALQASF